MRETFNLSFVFWIWLIWAFILGLKINSVSGFILKAEKDRLEIPALGRISYGIGSLYDGRTGNFLPLEFSVLSEKTRLDQKVVSRSNESYYSKFGSISLLRPSDKLQIVFEKPLSFVSTNDYDGLALRAVLDMLELPENGTGGFLLDKVSQEEMTQTETIYTHSFFPTFSDELILTAEKLDLLNLDDLVKNLSILLGQKPNPNLEGFDDGEKDAKILRREMRRNFRKMDIKILKKATHVVVKVIRGSQTVKSTSDSASASASTARVFSDVALCPPPPEGVPLSFELMPLLQFLNKTGLELTPSSRNKFVGLENSTWKNPMEIRHGRTFENLNWSWHLLHQMAKVNTTLHQRLQEIPRKAGEMVQELQNLYESFIQKVTAYKKDLKNLLEKSSSGTEQDAKLWDSIYGKEDGAVGTGVHWNFRGELEAAQEKILDLGGEFYNDYKSSAKLSRTVRNYASGWKIGCNFIPEIE